jgi:hypothetical protein
LGEQSGGETQRPLYTFPTPEHGLLWRSLDDIHRFFIAFPSSTVNRADDFSEAAIT